MWAPSLALTPASGGPFAYHSICLKFCFFTGTMGGSNTCFMGLWGPFCEGRHGQSLAGGVGSLHLVVTFNIVCFVEGRVSQNIFFPSPFISLLTLEGIMYYFVWNQDCNGSPMIKRTFSNSVSVYFL